MLIIGEKSGIIRKKDSRWLFMKIYKAGSLYSANEEVLNSFIKNGCFCIGEHEKRIYGKYYNILQKSEIGDIIYVKQGIGRGIRIKAIGFVSSNKIYDYTIISDIGNTYTNKGIKVKWVKDYTKNVPMEYYKEIEFPIRKVVNTIEEENNEEIKTKILLILDSKMGDI